MTQAALGLGANLDQPREQLRRAVARLLEHPGIEVRAVSGLWRTAPVGGPEQSDYLNAVVLVETSLSAEELLGVGHELEAAAGRVREVRWGPRSLDVDVLDVAGVVSGDPRLTLPHPRAHQRCFVLAPWEQVAPAWLLTPPGSSGRSVAAWSEQVRASTAVGDVVLVEEGPWWT